MTYLILKDFFLDVESYFQTLKLQALESSLTPSTAIRLDLLE